MRRRDRGFHDSAHPWVNHCLDNSYEVDTYTGPRERLLRKRERFKDKKAAYEWASQQPWFDRVVEWGGDARWWAWFLKPEGVE